MIRRHVTVSGRVQGVFFREACRRQALSCGVSGWVRNRHDGTVEAVLEGEQAAVERVLAWMRTGPPHATVDDLEIRPAEPAGERGFTVR